MTVLNSGISWCTGTLNLTGLGRLRQLLCGDGDCPWLYGQQGFLRTTLPPEAPGFAPAQGADGLIAPKMVFVNSLSDFWHEDIPNGFIEEALDAFEQHPSTIIQILTKRPARMRQVIQARYSNRGVPAHFWLGVSAEDNRVKGRLNILRRLKDQVGDFTAFVSVEPIVAPCDELDYTGIDWVLTGGESGPRCRRMDFAWLEHASERALTAGIPLHFKQYGHPKNSPYARHFMDGGYSASAALKMAIDAEHELAPQEKGGATYKGQLIQEKPTHFQRLKAELNVR